MTTRVISSELSDRDYGRRDFNSICVFIGRCRIERIPLDTPIPVEAYGLAHQAYQAEGRPLRSWNVRVYGAGGATMVCSEDAPELWERAREALTATAEKELAA